MRQAWLVAGFQHEHLPSEESGEESRLIHPGHTSISSSCYWVGFGFFFFLLLSFFRLLSRFDICWEGAGGHRNRAGVQHQGTAGGTPPLAAGSQHQPRPRRSGWKSRAQHKSLETPRVCSAPTQNKHTTSPHASVSLALRGVLVGNSGTSGDESPRGDTELQDGSPGASPSPTEDLGLPPRPPHLTDAASTTSSCPCSPVIPKAGTPPPPLPRSLLLPLPSSALREPSPPQKAPRALQGLFARGRSSLEIFKTHLDKVLCSLLWVTLLWQGGWTG